MSDRVALVTGGAGFVGSHIVDRLVSEGWRVAVIDDLSSGKSAYVNPQAELHEIDICDEGLGDLVRQISPDTVFHLAAQISVAVSAREPLLDARVNVIGLLNLLEAITSLQGSKADAAHGERDLPRFVFTSTGGAIYGEPERNPVKEEDPARPESPYAAAKLACEGYLGVYRATYGLDYSILRLANIYGPRQDPHGEAGVIAIFARAMLAGNPVKIFGDGEDERDYVYVSDAVDAFMAVSDHGGAGPYNIGSGAGTSVNYLFGELARLTEWQGTPQYVAPRKGDIHKVSLDAGLAHRDLGWTPAVTLGDGLIKTIEYFRNEVAGSA